jgi:hypothetical protein
MFQPFIRISRAVGVLFLSISSINLAFSQGSSVASLTTPDDILRTDSSATSEPAGAGEPAAILARFVTAESKVREALKQHMFKRDAVLQTIGPNGEVTGEYIRNSQFVFDDRGRRVERVLFHPRSTIREMRITKEDIQDLAGAQLLGIDIVEATKYRLTYAGTETVDSRQLFAVDVNPLVAPDPQHMSERFFVGRVWIDPTSFQIVKIRGIVEPQGKQRFPLFETWREPVNGGLAFPTRTEADDILHFLGRDVHYHIKVRYYDYKLFGSKVSITELDEPVPDTNEAPPKTKEAPKTIEAPPKRNEALPKIKEASPKLSEYPPSQLPPTAIDPWNKSEACATNRSAPPVGPYHWPADSDVKVYFVSNMFTSEQRATLLDAMKTWTLVSQEIGSGIKFIAAGETESRMSCRGCLTVGRRDVYKRDKHHYAFFHPMSEDEGRLLVSAWIDLDFGITSPKALEGFMAHELAHGLGLWDCTTCKKKLTIMNAFPGINKDNGLVAPSRCDLATVRDVYQQERQVAAAKSDGDKRPEGVRSDNALTRSLLGLEKASFSALDLQRPLVGGAAAAKSTGDKRPEAVPNKSIFALPPLGLDKPVFSLLDLRRSHIDRPFFFWGGIF